MRKSKQNDSQAMQVLLNSRLTNKASCLVYFSISAFEFCFCVFIHVTVCDVPGFRKYLYEKFTDLFARIYPQFLLNISYKPAITREPSVLLELVLSCLIAQVHELSHLFIYLFMFYLFFFFSETWQMAPDIVSFFGSKLLTINSAITNTLPGTNSILKPHFAIKSAALFVWKFYSN